MDKQEATRRDFALMALTYVAAVPLAGIVSRCVGSVSKAGGEAAARADLQRRPR